MRPSIFLTERQIPGLRSLADVKQSIDEGHAADVWAQILKEAEADLDRAPILPTSMTPGRHRAQAKRGNPDWTICHQAGQRVLRAALANLITEDRRFRDEALRQIDVLFDTEKWPQWRDQAHRPPADLRTGMLGMDLSIAYDWLHSSLTPDQRQWIVDGIDRRAIQPFWQAVDKKMGWVNGRNNWMTVIVGGLGVAGMALGADHPDSEKLVAFSLPRMETYLQAYGPEGEFNESIGYAGATRLPVAYYMAYWYATGGKENRLAEHPFPHTARWYAYAILPPGRVAAFGDAGKRTRADLTYFAPIASATRDPVLQWFYLNWPPRGSQISLPWMLLWFNASLEPTGPEGRWPHGRLFQAHGAFVSSRTDWSAASTPIVVYGKAGIERYHQHHDAGQVCIDGYGQQLIVDLGSPPGYPKDFFGTEARYQYYNASSSGHNIIAVGGREMRGEKGQTGTILQNEFDDERGAMWQLDLTGFYQGAAHVCRTVVHANPNVAVVVDEVALERDEPVALRWHPATPCEVDTQGHFAVINKGVTLSARTVAVAGGTPIFSKGRHEYRAPYDTYRLGTPLAQRREPFLQVESTGPAVTLLTLFATFEDAAKVPRWMGADGTWSLGDGANAVRVSLGQGVLQVKTRQASWQVSLAGTAP